MLLNLVILLTGIGGYQHQIIVGGELPYISIHHLAMPINIYDLCQLDLINIRNKFQANNEEIQRVVTLEQDWCK